MLSKGTVIIIAVCSAISLVFIVLVITHWYSPPSTPLPNIQPLAHYREQHLNNSSINTCQLFIPTISEPSSSTLSLLPDSPSTPSSSPRRSRSAGTRRGVPHGPHSQIDIILPAPLALTDGSHSTVSIVDKWVSAAGKPAPIPCERDCLT